MNKNYDVVIAGGGLNGCATAYWLASNPDFDGSILVVERDPTYENAPSAKASGGIRQQFSTPENIHIGLFGAAFVKSIEDYLGIDGQPTGVQFREQGYLLLATEETLPILRGSQQIQRESGADILLLTADEIATRFPWIRCDDLAGGCFGQSDEGWVDPYTFLQAFRRKARALGVEFAKDSVVDLNREGSRISSVRLEESGEVAADFVINVAGASGVRALANKAGVDVPIESRLRCTFVFECRETGIEGGPLTVLPGGVAWRPEGKRFISNMTPPPERDPETFEHNFDHDLFEDFIWPALAEWIPAFEAIKVVNGYSCHYDYNTLDENLIVGQLGDLENLFVATGLSGHGMQQAPAVGRALSELIVYGEYRSLDLSRFGYERVLSGAGIHETNCW